MFRPRYLLWLSAFACHCTKTAPTDDDQGRWSREAADTDTDDAESILELEEDTAGEDSDGTDGDDTGIDLPPDDSASDTDTPADTGGEPHDTDTGGEPHDTDADGTAEVLPLDGFGEITGDCDALTLPGESGRMLHNTIDFGSSVFDAALLSPGGSELFSEGTLGGSSIHSEVFAFEVLYRCERASLLKSETEITYVDESGKKTDMLVQIDEQKVGVSVTRAFKWGEGAIYTEEDAHALLSDKLSDVILSAANAAEADAWSHAVLHVITYDGSYIESLEAAYAALPSELTSDTIVVLTVTEGDDAFIY